MKKNNIFTLKPRYLWIPSFRSAFLICCFAVPQPTFGLLLRGQAHWINVAVILLLFLLEGQKEIRVNKFFLRLIANKRFQRLYQDQLDFDILYTWRVNSTKGVEFDFLPFAHYAPKVGDFMQSLAFLIPWVMTSIFMPWIRSSFKFEQLKMC